MPEILSPEHIRAIRLALSATNERLRSLWPGSNPGVKLEIKIKADRSRVSSADLEINSALMKMLAEMFPDDGVISEESEPSEAPTQQRVWIMDPLDGTEVFLKGKTGFSTLLGLCVNGRPEAVFLAYPVRNQVAWAVKGQGAFIDDSPAVASTAPQIRPGKLLLRHLEKLPADPRVAQRHSVSSEVTIGLATGELDGFILKLLNHREWDLAAQVGLVELSGGKVTDETGEPFRFGLRSARGKYLIASNGLVHEELFEFYRSLS